VTSWTLRARAPHIDGGEPESHRDRPAISRDPDVLAAFVEDAAHFPGGHAAGVATPETEVDIARLLKATSGSVLVVGAQSSLTGGATPSGDLVISTRKLTRIEHLAGDRVRAQAGVPLSVLEDTLARSGLSYPPVPTFTGAFVGGVVATNAAGAATFKHGATRDWVEALTVVLPDGDVLDIERGATRAHADGYFDLVLSRGAVRLHVPTYRMPSLAKLSAGYFAAPGMDLIDLFIGAEGTLGVVSSATLRVLSRRPAQCLALVPCTDGPAALALVGELRRHARQAWASGDPRGLDVSAIEHMDRRSLQIVREDRPHGVQLPASFDSAEIALLVTLDLESSTSTAHAFDQIGRALDGDAPDTPLVRLCRLLAASPGVELDAVQLAAPGDQSRAAQLLAVREAVPTAVNQRVARAKQLDERIEKIAGDLIVPFERLDALVARCHQEADRRGLDLAIWGHVSDGNIHPNVVPRSFADVQDGKEAVLAMGQAAIELGGAPLAEHGVGRNPVKQQLLRLLYGDEGIEQMRRVKRAIDPDWKLAPGVLFQR
jgi:D-lactate dehydrogenase (cytochrome)